MYKPVDKGHLSDLVNEAYNSRALSRLVHSYWVAYKMEHNLTSGHSIEREQELFYSYQYLKEELEKNYNILTVIDDYDNIDFVYRLEV